MFIDFKKLFGDNEQKREYDFAFDLSFENFLSYAVPKPVTGKISFRQEQAAYCIELEALAEIVYDCAKCLEPSSKTVKIKRTAFIRTDNLHDEEEDLPFNENDCLDVKELVYTELVLKVPPVLLCGENCKGICPVCGKKRTDGCSCEQQPQDERLAILKQLLS